MFDIILVYNIFRNHSYYNNIVKALSPKFSIGIFPGLFPEKDRQKNTETDQLYTDQSKQFGAVILDEGEHSCNLLLLSQNSAEESRILYIKNHINYKNSIVLQFFGQGYNSLKIMEKNSFNKLWIYNKKIFDVMVKKEKTEEYIKDFEITNINLPFNKYPISDFSNLKIDYLIAYPSQLFLKDIRNEMNLFCNMRRLLKMIPYEKKVYIKQHNVSENKNRLNHSLSKYKSFFVFEILLLFMKIVIKKILRRDTKLSDAFNHYKIKKARQYIEKRAIPLSEVTKFHNINIEHFLPFVKEGVITGISTCIYNALENNVPVYNCDSQPLTDELPNYDVVKNYIIPSCNGELKFDPAYYDFVKREGKNHDMIELLKQYLA